MCNEPGVTTNELWISSEIKEIHRVHACIEVLLMASKCTALDRVAIRLAVDEALLNAIAYGNQLEPNRFVHVVYWGDEAHIAVRIEDEGQGFDPASVPIPSTREWIDAPAGRGLLIMRRFMHEVSYDKRGCAVTMKRFLCD